MNGEAAQARGRGARRGTGTVPGICCQVVVISASRVEQCTVSLGGDGEAKRVGVERAGLLQISDAQVYVADGCRCLGGSFT